MDDAMSGDRPMRDDEAIRYVTPLTEGRGRICEGDRYSVDAFW